MFYRLASTVDREAVVGLVVDTAEAAALRLTPPDLLCDCMNLSESARPATGAS